MIIDIDREHMARHVGEYLAISADASPWTAEHFLKDLPEKWSLSFGLWQPQWPGPAGYCILSRRNGVIHMNQLMVAPALRGQGHGAAMLAEAVRRGAETLKVDPANVGAIRFYARHGFAPTGDENGYLVRAAATAPAARRRRSRPR